MPPTSFIEFRGRVRGRSHTSWCTTVSTLMNARVPEKRAMPLMPSRVSRVQSDWLPTSVMVPARSPVMLASASNSGVLLPSASATKPADGHEEEHERDDEEEDAEGDRAGQDRARHAGVLLVRAEGDVDDDRAGSQGLRPGEQLLASDLRPADRLLPAVLEAALVLGFAIGHLRSVLVACPTTGLRGLGRPRVVPGVAARAGSVVIGIDVTVLPDYGGGPRAASTAAPQDPRLHGRHREHGHGDRRHPGGPPSGRPPPAGRHRRR